MEDYAKFTAEIAKGINIKESNVELKLLIPLKSAQEHLIFLSSNQGEKINVFLGDPQGSFDFGDEDPMYQKLTGRFVTTDQSGVVTKVEKPEGQEDDENEQTLFGQDLENEDGSTAGEQEGAAPAGGEDAGDPGQTELGSGLGENVPEWMTDGGDSVEGEMDFTDDGGQHDPEAGTPAGGDPAGEVEIGKEELEEYILNQQPVFEDIPFDFPQLLKRRKSEGKTWMQIAQEAGVSSSQISSKYSEYKKRVTKMMKDGGAA
ncbi:hypothetical protein NYE69_06825 [Paenibacillus sp. FSL R5-0527]|uniref:hypothetical protein n=1 Tax=Paenibacillus sp. FSL R5-0527 TaxID=2975321 RepID=UPI00097A4068|nr:hypothetical protein BK140_09240 [Paenibacillus macerans]